MSGDSFGQWLKGQLEQREWRAADLARRLDIRPGVISHWMRDERRPSTESCDLIADVFGLPVDVVLTVAGHRPNVEALDVDDPRELLAERVRRMRPDESDLATLNLMLDNWDARNKREGKR